MGQTIRMIDARSESSWGMSRRGSRSRTSSNDNPAVVYGSRLVRSTARADRMNPADRWLQRPIAGNDRFRFERCRSWRRTRRAIVRADQFRLQGPPASTSACVRSHAAITVTPRPLPAGLLPGSDRRQRSQRRARQQPAPGTLDRDRWQLSARGRATAERRGAGKSWAQDLHIPSCMTV